MTDQVKDTTWDTWEEWEDDPLTDEQMIEEGLGHLLKNRQKAGVKDNGAGTASFTGKLIGMGF